LLATESGALLFDDATETFHKIPHTGTAALINAAAAGGTFWLASEQSRLIKVTVTGNARATIAVSLPLAFGAPAEMFGTDDTLWLLVSSDGGEAYRVAYVTGDRTQLDVVAGRYFSLRQDGGGLVADAQTKALLIDPRNRTGELQTLDAKTARGRVSTAGVTFRGSSYSVKDPSEIVEQRPLDISRGWSDPELLDGAVATRR
jgi:hypothetical protein